MNDLQSFLCRTKESFITYRKASGSWNDTYNKNLLLFASYCIKEYPLEKGLTQKMVDNWCRQRDTERNNSCADRIKAIVAFIRYLRQRNETEVIEPIMPTRERSTYIPHAFTETELKIFFSACDSLPATHNTMASKIKRLAIPVFFRLLYSSGIRPNEARLLRVKDVDLVNGILNIRYSKGPDQHFIALHDTMLELMQKYDLEIRKIYPDRIYFFPTKDNSHHKNRWVCRNFGKLWHKYNTAHATAYALRHHYAIQNINQWVNEGFDFDATLLYLSKSMGHRTFESTRYYYGKQVFMESNVV